MPVKGRRTSLPADAIGDDFTPNCLNVRFRFGEIRPTPGRNILAGSVGTTQTPLWIGQFPQLDGTTWIVMLTTTRMFRWGVSAPGSPRNWNEVLPGDTVPTGTTRWSVAIGEGKLFFARHEDLIYYWTGVSTDPFRSIVAQAGVQGTVPKAKFIEYFNNRLIAGFTTEGSVDKSNRLRWTESANFLHWDETLALGAGFLDLVEGGQEAIRGLRCFSTQMMVTTRRTIKEIIATGTTPTHVEALRARGMGCDSPYTIASAGQQAFFVGYDFNVYAWDGIRLIPIGEPIYEELKSVTNPGQNENYFATVSTTRQEYWLVLPSGDAFIFDYIRGTWARDTVPAFTALGEVEDTLSTETWATSSGPWSTDFGTWEMLRGVNHTILVGGRQGGTTAVIDEGVNYDYFSIGSIMDRFVETPDFYTDEFAGTGLKTVYRLLVNYEFTNDLPFEVGMSFDRGRSWKTQIVNPARSGFTWVDFEGTGNTVRFRFREQDANAAFRWRSFTYEFVPAGDFIGTTTA